MTRHSQQGFTLIELAIALVVIGLLVGGVVAGRELIRSSESQTVIKDVAAIQVALRNFRMKYEAIPGDFNKATNYWGLNPNCATGGTGTGTETCDGNGNNSVLGNSSYPYEQFYFWQHLANSGFIPGRYTGAPIAAANFAYCQPGQNCPMAKIASNVTFFFYNVAAQTNPANPWWIRDALNVMFIGAANPTPGVNYPAYAFLTPTEAYSIDSKIDDGLPGKGKWVATNAFGLYIPNCVVNSSTGLALTDSSAASAATAIYNGNYSGGNACSFLVTLF